MKQISIDVSSSEVGAALAWDGALLADLFNEIAMHVGGEVPTLPRGRLAEFLDEIDNDGAAIVCQLAAALGYASELRAAAKEVMAALHEYGPSIVPHLMDDDMNAGQRLRAAIASMEPR